MDFDELTAMMCMYKLDLLREEMWAIEQVVVDVIVRSP